MKRRLTAGALAAAFALATLVGPTLAAKPAHPGCFGRDRAAWIHANGGAAWGKIASTRAGDNGTINKAYKIACGGAPTH